MAVSLLNLPKPSSSSHKGQNGVVLIIGGSKTYHGAPILAAIAAVRFCDLVYFSSTEENNLVMRRMKLSTPNVISLPSSKLKWAISIADCVLIGNGMDVGAATKRLTASVLRTGKRCVIDAAALRVLSRIFSIKMSSSPPTSVNSRRRSAFRQQRRISPPWRKNTAAQSSSRGNRTPLRITWKNCACEGGECRHDKGRHGGCARRHLRRAFRNKFVSSVSRLQRLLSEQESRRAAFQEKKLLLLIRDLAL